MAQFETWLRSDLSHILQVQKLDGVVFSEDSKGNLIGVEVFDKGQKATLSGTVTGYILKADGQTVAVSGTASGNKASIILPSNAYNVPGPIAVAIKLSSGSGSNTVRTTLCACQSYVKRTSTDDIVTPEYAILDLETLLTKISEMETKTAAANTAANNANTKATAANTAASSANTAATRANTAAAKLENITADAETLTPGTGAAATISEVSGHYHLHVGVEKGDKGDKGDTPLVTSVRNEYLVDADGQTVPTNDDSRWSSVFPSVPQGRFLWIKTVTSWNNGQTFSVLSGSRMGINGTGSVSSVNNIDPDANGNITIPIDSQPTADSPNPITSGAVASAMDAIRDDFVAKTGSEMTGNLTIARASPGLYFKKTSGGAVVGGIYHVVDSGGNNLLALQQRMDGSAAAEGFFLPSPTSHSSFTAYTLLTTKKTVTVAQGGTGATTAAAARENLGIGDSLYKSAASGDPMEYVFSGACIFVILTSGYAINARGAIFGSCNASGTISHTEFAASGGTYGMTISTETNKLTITNGSAYSASAVFMKLTGTTPT